MQFIINKKGDHSLGPDYFTGWKLNSTNYKFRQIPLVFTNWCADNISKTLTSFGSQQPFRVVYMGARYTSNFKAYKAYARTDQFESSICKFQNQIYGQFFLKYEFKYFHEKEKVFPIRPLQYRLFTGMNPTIKKDDLRFDANFQCGNLDLAISINSFEYDLLMRVDSNTKGHTTWFYFKVTNFSDKQKVKFNIINFQKNGLMYKQGMKPYCYRSSSKKWQQQGTNVQYRPKKFRYNFENSGSSIVMNCLSFMFQFKEQDEYVCFAYCVPYTYSYMMHRVASLQRQNPHFVSIQRNFFSTGGLQIPVLTITNHKDDKEKPCCFVVGRLHPGQTQGSWALDGFLRFLCSPKGYYLREKILFKIAPMVNVDGVVLGNFRTGISGRDLNRVFDQPENYGQINIIRSLAQKHNPLLFLDFHGHSAKKNAFMYGPNYSVDHKYYITSRLLPKFISKLTTVFRYYSCIFRISKSKINTGRAIMIRQHNVAFSFTIETSAYAYGPKTGEKMFDRLQYSNVGESIAEGLQRFVKILLVLPKRLEKADENGTNQQKLQNEIKQPSPRHSKEQNKKQTMGSLNIISNLLSPKIFKQLLSAEQKSLIQQLISEQKQLDKQKKGGESEISDSDFEDGDDYNEKQLKIMFKSEIEDQITVEKIKKKKKAKNKNQSSQKLNLFTQRATVSPNGRHMNSIKLLKRQKIEDNKINKINYKPVSLNRVDQIQQKLPQIKRQNSFLPNISEQQVVNQSLNKVYYNNWKKIINPFDQLERKYKKASSSLNHINLDYNIDRQRQQQQQVEKKKKHSRQRQRRSRFHKEKEQEKSFNKPLRNHSLKQNLDEIDQKQLLLPLLSKNKSLQLQMIPGGSSIGQILAHHQKMQRAYLNKNIKIVYF